MMKYLFWFYLVSFTVLLSFPVTQPYVVPVVFFLTTLYARWIHGNLVAFSKIIHNRTDSQTESLNKCIGMINDHTSLIKKLVPVEKLLPSIERKVDRLEKDTQRNKEILKTKK